MSTAQTIEQALVGTAKCETCRGAATRWREKYVGSSRAGNCLWLCDAVDCEFRYLCSWCDETLSSAEVRVCPACGIAVTPSRVARYLRPPMLGDTFNFRDAVWADSVRSAKRELSSLEETGVRLVQARIYAAEMGHGADCPAYHHESCEQNRAEHCENGRPDAECQGAQTGCTCGLIGLRQILAVTVPGYVATLAQARVEVVECRAAAERMEEELQAYRGRNP